MQRRSLVLSVTVPLALACAAVSLLALPCPTAAAARRKAGAGSGLALEKEARAFLELVTGVLVPVATVSSQAAWDAAVDVTPEHRAARRAADQAYAALAGSKAIIDNARRLLERERELDELTARQLRRLLLTAAESPGTIPGVVARRVEAETRQAAVQEGFVFCLRPRPGGGCLRPTTANEIDNVLRTSRDLAERQRVWNAAYEIGRPLKPGLVALQRLRNQVAREMGYSSYFALRVADYGMTVAEMMALLDATLEATRPLYDGLHCLTKQRLAQRYRRPAPKLLPAHWVGNRWAQQWPGVVEEVSLDAFFKGASPQTIVKSAEGFYQSLGFAALPEGFWGRSDLYPVPPGAPRRKSAHGSAWHIDLDGDVRALMNVESNQRGFEAAHHELGHVYYFLAYSRPEVPPLLRQGANRALHEAIGELGRLASSQTPYLAKIGVLPQGREPDATARLLQSAMESIVFLPFAAGTMSHFEHDLYEKELPEGEWQRRWWQYVATFQGVEPPSPRPDALCDACSKTHINDAPAQYYDYVLATLIKFQLHEHICTKILKQDVRACDYSGSKETGSFLRGLLELGATRDGRAVVRQATGEELSARAMLAFYQPLVAELAARNAGRDCSR